MPDPLLGLRVRIIIDEDGTQSLPPIPPGTITRRLDGARGGPYHVVRLDHGVECLRAKTGQTWTLGELVFAPRFVGDSLQRLLRPPTADPLLVSIANVIEPLREGQTLDASRVVYFALGRVERA